MSNAKAVTRWFSYSLWQMQKLFVNSLNIEENGQKRFQILTLHRRRRAKRGLNSRYGFIRCLDFPLKVVIISNVYIKWLLKLWYTMHMPSFFFCIIYNPKKKHKNSFFLNVCCALVFYVFLCCSVCWFLYGPFCHGALKLNISTVFITFFLWTSL